MRQQEHAAGRKGLGQEQARWPHAAALEQGRSIPRRTQRTRPRTRPKAARASACPSPRAGALPPRADFRAGRCLAGIKRTTQPQQRHPTGRLSSHPHDRASLPLTKAHPPANKRSARASACPSPGLALWHLTQTSGRGGTWHHKTHPLTRSSATPRAGSHRTRSNNASLPLNSAHPPANKAKGRAGERLPVPTGWRLATSRRPQSGEVCGTIKHAAHPQQRHPTARLSSRPDDGASLPLSSAHPPANKRSARASACPSPGLALCHLTLTSGRGGTWHHKARRSPAAAPPHGQAHVAPHPPPAKRKRADPSARPLQL